MPRASRVPVRKEVSQELDDNFSILISSLSDSLDIEQFFRDFLTEEEKTMLTKRLMLHLMLEKDYKTSQIMSVLHVSRETVRIHKNLWATGGEAYKRTIKKIAKRGNAKEFWKKVEKILRPFDLAMNAKNDMRARAKLVSGDWYND